ncbi:MAG: HpcH/HpaI aldolase/citrate lyase family protein [Caulobacteraceae bacterium]
MTPRSWLFVPGDNPAKMDKAAASGADAVIFDLEDSVAESGKAAARGLVAQALERHLGLQRYVRINPLSTPHVLHDLAAVVAARPDGVVLPKPDSAADAVRLGDYLSALEAQAGLAIGGIRILPIATETPRSLFALGGYADAAGRLAGLTWGAEDLPAAVGAATNTAEDGGFTDLCRLARSLCLAGAAGAEVPAIETVYPAFRDLDGLRAYATRGRREGFVGMLAIHPAQVTVINQVFTPSEAELDHARAVVSLFAAHPDAGVLALDGKMVDRPHLKQAQAVLAREVRLSNSRN